MPIRWKFFLILLVFSILPLLVVNAILHGNLVRLGDRLAEGAYHRLLDQAESELVQHAEAVARLLQLESEGLELALRYLTAEAERALAAPAPESAAYLTPEDFNHPEGAAALVTSPRYQGRDASGLLRELPISLEAPVALAPQSLSAVAWQPDARRLARLMPVFRHLHGTSSTAVHRAYIGLASGLHVAYPGHGPYPPGFDPRRRPWYQAAQDSAAPLWLSYLDASSGQTVFTVAMPLREPGGRTVGVAALDSLPVEVLRARRLQARWSEDSHVYLISTARDSDSLMVVAAGHPDPEPAPSASDRSGTSLTSHDAAGMQALLQALGAGRAGLVAMPRGTQDALWAFAPLKARPRDDLAVLIVVPRRTLTATPEQVRGQVREITDHMHLLTAAVSGAMALLVLLMAFFGSRAATRPMLTIVEAWRRLASGDFSVRLHLRSRDERDIVYRAFNDTIPKLEAHFHLNRSLELAREIQQNLLPRSLPDLPGLDVAGACRYCDQTGGDYWDVFPTGPAGGGTMAVIVGDVSGHGVAAALLMTTARALIRSLALVIPDPAVRLGQVNRLLYADCADSGSFLTLFHLEIDLQRRRAWWIRAGHDPGLLYDPPSDRFTELTGEGMALGIEADVAFSAQPLELDRPGQVIVIGTDGIWEAFNPQGAMYGKERLLQVIRTHAHLSSAAIREAIFRDVTTFVGPQDFADDITVALVKVLPPPPSSQ
jgi:sigma-B regulation protein RsbU (phosphoserine phosphatase)